MFDFRSKVRHGLKFSLRAKFETTGFWRYAYNLKYWYFTPTTIDKTGIMMTTYKMKCLL